jgi:hypothetical protein
MLLTYADTREPCRCWIESSSADQWLIAQLVVRLVESGRIASESAHPDALASGIDNHRIHGATQRVFSLRLGGVSAPMAQVVGGRYREETW